MAEYKKAIYGAVVAGLTALGTALADGTITNLEWIGIALAIVAAGGAVWKVENAPSSTAKR